MMQLSGDGTIAGLVAGGLPALSVTPANLSQKMTLATAQATTSGTSINFPGIPSWAQRITAMLNDVSTNGTSDLFWRFGTAAGVQVSTYSTAGYGGQNAGSLGLNIYTTGVTLQHNSVVAATDWLKGSVTFTLMDPSLNLWAVSGLVFRNNSTANFTCIAGTVALSGLATSLHLTTGGGVNVFDGGSVNILIEG